VRLSPNLQGIAGSETLRIAALSAELSARGVRVISLSAGEPDFATPEHVRAAAERAIAEGRTRYTPNAGIAPLREALAGKLRSENGVAYAPDEIVVSAGAKQVLFNACQVLFGPGDEVIVPAPYWVSYPAMVRLARATPVFVAAGREEGYKVSAAQVADALTPRTRGLILNSPSNPTGAVYDEMELADLAALCEEHDIWILSDEIYERLCYERERAPSIAALGPEVRARSVTVNGFSKCFAMTGWRLGYGAAPREVARAMDVVQSHCTSNASSVSQYAGLAALTEREASERAIQTMRRAFHARRDRLVAGLAGLPGVDCVTPAGAFDVWCDVRGAAARAGSGSMEAAPGGHTVGLADDFCARLLERQALALVPGGAFGMDGHVRWSFAAAEEVIDEGVARFREAVLARES
jgi:aspartate aminotransferase